MKKLLVVFSIEFPYGISEPFLEAEWPFYKNYFDKVLLVTNKPNAGSGRGESKRQITDAEIELVETHFNNTIWDKIQFIFSAIGDINFYKEALLIFKTRRRIMKKLTSLFRDIGKANICVNTVRARILSLEKEGYTLSAAYSYWLVYTAYAAVKLSKKYYSGNLYTLSRAHRFDLYENRDENKYLPCRKYILQGLNEIASISDDGKQYLSEAYPNFKMNITVRRLGAKDVGKIQSVSNNTPVFKILSCSRVTPIKRIDRIIQSLAGIKDIRIEWTHVGGGSLLDSVKEKAKSLPLNIKAVFTDTIPNTEVYKLYSENKYHVFVNVSESEGIPVSIMEAMSFGTPVVATNTGGVKEMIDVEANGYLLDENFDIIDLTNIIRKIHGEPQEKYLSMRSMSRTIFERKFNAETNYNSFLKSLSEH